MLTKLHPGVQALLAADQIVLSTHMGADADGLGSALALSHALQALGKKARVVLPDPIFRRVRFLDGEGECLIYGVDAEAEHFVQNADQVVILDTLVMRGSSALVSRLEEQALPTFAIDHHLGTGRPCDILVSDAAATGEIVFHLVQELQVPVSPKMATWLFASISSDTHSFRFVRGRAETFRMAARLVEAGADPWFVQEGLYQSASPDALLLKSRVFGSAEKRCEGRAIIAWISQEMVADLTLDRDDHRELIQDLISQEGVRAAVTIMQVKDGSYKLSFRGRAGLNLEPIARSLGGGGHAQACGASTSLEEESLRHQIESQIDQMLFSA